MHMAHTTDRRAADLHLGALLDELGMDARDKWAVRCGFARLYDYHRWSEVPAHIVECIACEMARRDVDERREWVGRMLGG